MKQTACGETDMILQNKGKYCLNKSTKIVRNVETEMNECWKCII